MSVPLSFVLYFEIILIMMIMTTTPTIALRRRPSVVGSSSTNQQLLLSTMTTFIIPNNQKYKSSREMKTPCSRISFISTTNDRNCFNGKHITHSSSNNNNNNMVRLSKNQVSAPSLRTAQQILLSKMMCFSSSTSTTSSYEKEINDTKRDDKNTSTNNNQAGTTATAAQSLSEQSSIAAASLARQKRKAQIGLAKAVDRGYKHITPYMPAGTTRLRRKQTINDSNDQDENPDDDDDDDNKNTVYLQYQSLSGLPIDRTKPFVVLGIETSCDDTGCAIVRSDGTILGEALFSQTTIHEPHGGIVPGLARDSHIEMIDAIIQLALERANVTCIQTQIDAIGVTVGPGLEICLRVGTNKAIELSKQYNKPFVGVHHLEAHILMARLPTSTTATSDLVYTKPTNVTHGFYRTMDFPFLSLLVSGGHCQLIVCRGIGDYTIMGGTMDDSLGEVYDKTARLLGLPIGGGSGGPAIEQLALLHTTNTTPTSTTKKKIQFTVPMQNRKHDCDFSFAGLKSNVRRYVDKLVLEQQQQQQQVGDTNYNNNHTNHSIVMDPTQLSIQDKAAIAYAFQDVAIQHLEQRLVRAMDILEQEQPQQSNNSHGNHQGSRRIRTLAVVGGVAANQQLRKRIQELCNKRSWTMMVPPPRLCTDQGTMSAWAAIERLMVGSSDDPSTQQVYARYPFVSMTTEPTTHRQH